MIAQTVADWELIVIDDGSRDDTTAVVAGYLSDDRVRYVRQAHAGRSVARNRGVALAATDRICFLDSDDTFLPTALESHLRTLENAEERGLAIGGYETTDALGNVVGARRPWAEGGTLAPESWLFDCFAMPGSVMVERAWLDRVGGFDPATETGEDWDLFLRLAFTGCPMAWTSKVVCRRRQHPGNSTNHVVVHQEGLQRALDKVFRRPDLPPEVRGLENRARAWAFATFARAAAAAGRDALVRDNLRAASELNAVPSWRRSGLSLVPAGFPTLIEGLISDAFPHVNAATDVYPRLAQLALRGASTPLTFDADWPASS